MQNKLLRLSFNQLILLQYFLSKPGKVVTIPELERKTKLTGRSLGGILSSLSRTKFRDRSLLVPAGKSKDGIGLRWMLNLETIDVAEARETVAKLLASY